MTEAEIDKQRRIAYCLSYCLLGQIDENLMGLSYQYNDEAQQVELMLHVAESTKDYDQFLEDIRVELVHEERLCQEVSVVFEQHRESDNRHLTSWFLKKRGFGSCRLLPG